MKRMLTMVAALVLVLCTFVTGAMADTTMYVRTGNGKTLNVRSEPNTGDNVIYRFQYGQEVIVAYHLGNGWSCVRLAGAFDQDGYVMTKFLVNEKPGKYVPSSADAELAQPATSKESFTMDQLNEVLKTGRSVAPYTITLYPTRASGWVYLRWVPSRNAQQIATYPGGKEVRVIAELKDWYQIEDPETGVVGFVNSSYVH